MSNRIRTWAKGGLIATVGLIAACNQSDNDQGPSGSQVMVTSSDMSALYIATADDGVLTRVDLATRRILEMPLDGEPTRVARIGDRLFVTLRTERSLVELIDQDGQLVRGRTVSVGAEPVGVVATNDGTRLYVAASLTGRVLELDAETLQTLRIWELPNEPRWLALNPNRNSLYVAGAWEGRLVHVDLGSGEASRVVIEGPFRVDRPTGRPSILTPRITGDLDVSPNGDTLAVPMLFVNNTTPIAEDSRGEGPPPPPGEGGYGDRIVPAVVMFDIDELGRPSTDAKVMVSLTLEAVGAPSSYPSSVTFTPDGSIVVATIEGASQLMYFNAGHARSHFGEDMSFLPVASLSVGRGPRSVAFTSSKEGFVYNFLDRTTTGFVLSSPDFGGFVGTPGASIVVATNRLPDDVENGRRLFYSSSEPIVTNPRISVSCGTCHFEGRNDGLTWVFERGPRQTPSLAGMISLREPVRWDGLAPTVADDALETAQQLMGAFEMTPQAAQDIAAFIDYVRSVDTPDLGIDNAQVALGREIFNRSDVACGTCHAGPIFSDKQTYNMFGLDGVKTPSLLGVSATPPYLHDGSAPTLRAVLDASRGGEMGNTGNLSEEEMQALEAYLRTL